MTPKLSITPLTGTGLTWYECEVPKQLFPGWQTCEQLLGFSRNDVEWGENSPFGEHFDVEGELAPRIRLTIGEDVFELRHHPHDGRGYSDNQGMAYYTIDKNSQLLYSIFTPYAWRQSLLNISGKYTLHLGSPGSDVIIYDGVDLREAYNLDGAAIPWALNNQLIFIGYKNERYFVIYDGKQIGPKFSHILIAYCCETALYSVQRPLGQYWFNGERDGRYYVVAITVDQ